MFNEFKLYLILTFTFKNISYIIIFFLMLLKKLSILMQKKGHINFYEVQGYFINYGKKLDRQINS